MRLLYKLQPFRKGEREKMPPYPPALLLVYFLLLTSYFLLSTAYAQLWTIQTAAFRDYRDAIAAVDQLKTQGFDAYSEFAMGSDNQQYTRVRIGCFDSKETADLTVQRLLGAYTKEAASVTLSPGTPIPTCLMRSIGFIAPSTWYIYSTTPDYAVFMVDFQGKQAFIKYDGATWQMGQNLSELGVTASGPSPGSGYFSEVAASPYPQIIYTNGASRFITQGRLLWQRYDIAVIAEGDTVVAYQIVRY
jgi:SPOR domain